MRKLVAISTMGLLAVVALSVMAGGAGAAVGPTDVSLTKADTADPVTVGDTFGYVITVKNAGTNDAGDVIVTDTLSSKVSYLSSTPTGPYSTCQRSGTKVTCDLGQLNAGATASVTILVKASSSGTATDTAALTSADDTNASNNVDSETTTINSKPSTPKAPKHKHKGRASCAAPTVIGTAGDDVLQGTNRADAIVALGGNDVVYGGSGNDVICAGTGTDIVLGGSGKDFVNGGGGPDRLVGQDGGDTLKGKSGPDRLSGGKGDDTLVGGKGRDKCKGGSGHNVLISC
jgi:uncharacterized repeat protein (TIGR01451 family)